MTNGFSIPDPVSGCEQCEELVDEMYRYASAEAQMCGLERYLEHLRDRHTTDRNRLIPYILTQRGGAIASEPQ